MKPITVLIAVLAGFTGGSLAPLLMTPVHAQNTVPKPAVNPMVQAKSFILLDGSGRKRGEWNLDPAGQPVLQLFDETGRVIWDSTDRAKMKMLSR